MPEATAAPKTAAGYTHLLSPFAIGRVQLRNRVVFQPHFTALGHLDGMPSDDHVAYHEERARGWRRPHHPRKHGDTPDRQNVPPLR